jgi:hypothetical protein
MLPAHRVWVRRPDHVWDGWGRAVASLLEGSWALGEYSSKIAVSSSTAVAEACDADSGWSVGDGVLLISLGESGW